MRHLYAILILMAGVGLSHAQTLYVQVCSFTSTVPACKWVPSSFFVGPMGPQGNAATITVAATITAPAGTPADVRNMGDSHAASLVFTIPAGKDGTNGIDGNPGPPGPPIAGLSSDGANGIKVAGNVSANSFTVPLTGVPLKITGFDPSGKKWDCTIKSLSLTSAIMNCVPAVN